MERSGDLRRASRRIGGRLALLVAGVAAALIVVGCASSAPAATIPSPTAAPVAQTPTATVEQSVPLSPQPGTRTPTSSTRPSPLATATTVPPTPTGETGAPAVVESVRFALVGQLRLADPADVRVVSWEQVDWPDGCLGITIRDVACTAAIVPGYRVVLEIPSGARYEYRTDLDGRQVMLAMAPPTGIERPALAWEGEEPNSFCQSLTMAPNGEALVGICGGPQAPVRLAADVGRPDQLEYLLGRFAAFSAETSAGKLEFYGQGQEIATPAWQRAIAEWSRIVQQELRWGRSGASWAMAIAWQEPSTTAGRCENLQVEVYGLALAATASCEGGDPQEHGAGWLATDDLAGLYDWLDRLAAFERPAPGRLVFSGTGQQQATDADVNDIADWARQQFEARADADGSSQ